jgi:hypothetical protein
MLPDAGCKRALPLSDADMWRLEIGCVGGSCIATRHANSIGPHPRALIVIPSRRAIPVFGPDDV